MKSTKLFFPFCSVFFSCLLWLTSCEKATLSPVSENGIRSGSPLLPSCTDCGDYCNWDSVLEAIRDPEDPQNDRINLILYHYSIALKDIFALPPYRSIVLTALGSDHPGPISLLELAESHPEFGAVFNQYLRLSIAAEDIYPHGAEADIAALVATPGWDANAYLANKLIKAGYVYEPVIYERTPLAEVETERVTFLIAQEVNDCDDVAGWRDGTEVLVSEAEARAATDLLVFVGPGKGQRLEGEGPADRASAFDDGRIPRERRLLRGEELIAKSGKIKGLSYRYEKSGKSEVVAFVTGWATDPTNPWIKNNSEAQEKFSKNEIRNQTTVSINRSLAGIIESAAAANLFIGFYEYDWYISNRNLKSIACPCNREVPDAKLAMKFKHEWYNTDKFCGRLTTLIPVTNGSKTIDNYKGTFVIQRRNL